MGKDAGSPPAAPDPKQLIPLQAAADKNAFNYQTDANRFNTSGPDQSQTWNKTSVFDESAYNKALADWNSTSQQGTWVPPTEAGSTYLGTGNEGMMYGNTPGTPGYWAGASGPKGEAPLKDAFTTNKYDLTTTLSPEAQKLHSAEQGLATDKNAMARALMERLGPTFGSKFDTSSAPALMGGVDMQTDPGIAGFMEKLGGLDPRQFNREAADALYSQQTRYLDPQVQQQQKALEARLSEQGFVPGTPGYAQAMQTFQDTNARAYGGARDSATALGSQVGHTQFADASSSLTSQIAAALQGAGFGNDARLKDATFQNTARNQGVQELLQERQVPMSDLNTLMSFLGNGGNTATNAGSAAVPQGGVGSLQQPDQMAAYNDQYKNLMGQYNADVQSDNNTTSTLVSLAGAALMF
jgi:hypothetical protein